MRRNLPAADEATLDAATPNQVCRANAAVEANLVDGAPRWGSAQGYACALTAIIEADKCADSLRGQLRNARTAIAIEAATAGETPESGSTEGESAAAKPDAQGPSQ